ncbi:hypothetical protein CASP1_00009 [Alcaligenes phage CASP1]|nr:hypothetical protein CASP1_00009 [Alcaligenes phage CASP1]
MSEYKHTAGPWTDGKSIPITAKSCEENGFSFVYVNRDDKTEQEANARLISAAPELLHRLQEPMEMLECIAEGKEWGAIEDQINDNRAAIAKATGATE